MDDVGIQNFPESPAKQEVWFWHANLDLLATEGDTASLSPDEIERSARFRFEHLRRRFAAGRAFLRRTLAQLLEVEPETVRFNYASLGKPSVDFRGSEAARPLFFNLSHCEEQLVLAISRNSEVGIDVEKVRKLPDEEALVNRFFEKREREEYHALPDSLKTHGFFNCWTRKEAVLKAKGCGLSIPLDSFRVSLDPRRRCELLDFDQELEKLSYWRLLDIDSESDSKISLAIRNSEANKTALGDHLVIAGSTFAEAQPNL